VYLHCKQCCNQVLKEFERLEKKDCSDRFSKFWTNNRIATIVKMAEKKAQCAPFISQLATVSTVDIERKEPHWKLVVLVLKPKKIAVFQVAVRAYL
jgi:hypothetical protein